MTTIMMINDTDIGSIERFCCFYKQLNEVISSNQLLSIGLYNATYTCVADLNITYGERIKLLVDILYTRNGFAGYKEDDCIETSDSHIGYMCIWMMLFLLVISSNITVVLAVNKISYLKENVGNFLISSLAIADVCVGLFIIPIKIRFAYKNMNLYSEFLCRFYITIDNAIFSTSVTSLFFIAIDRYLTLAYPYKYKDWLTLRKCKIVIAGIWLYGLIWGLLSNINWHESSMESIVLNADNKCIINGNTAYVTTVYIFVFYVPAVAMAGLYTRVFSIARQHARSIALNIPFSNDNGKSETNLTIPCKDKESNRENHCRQGQKTIDLRSAQYRKMTLKASKTVATIYGAFIVCWLPVSVISLAVAHKNEQIIQSMDAEWFYHIFVEVLPIFNSMLNPFIYALMNKNFRCAYRTVLKRFDVFIWKSKDGIFQKQLLR